MKHALETNYTFSVSRELEQMLFQHLHRCSGLGRERAHHGPRFPGNNGEQGACSPVGTTASLFPCMNRSYFQSEGARESRLREPKPPAHSSDIYVLRNGNSVVGEHL